MLLYGAGGHAKMIISCLQATDATIDALFDDNPAIIPVIQTPFFGLYNQSLFIDKKIIIAIGDNQIRKKVAAEIAHQAGNVFHPSAIIDSDVRIDEGTVVFHRCVIQPGVSIGKHVIVNTGAIVEHDGLIADFVHLAPGVVICGNVKIGENTLIGAGTVISPNLTIGKNCLIAAGSVVTTNIPDGSVVRGNPARAIKTNI